MNKIQKANNCTDLAFPPLHSMQTSKREGFINLTYTEREQFHAAST
jgi:hypothetical protein